MIGTYDHAAVDEEGNAVLDENGTPVTTTLYNLNTNELQWAMVNVIKEIDARLAALEAS